LCGEGAARVRDSLSLCAEEKEKKEEKHCSTMRCPPAQVRPSTRPTATPNGSFKSLPDCLATLAGDCPLEARPGGREGRFKLEVFQKGGAAKSPPLSALCHPPLVAPVLPRTRPQGDTERIPVRADHNRSASGWESTARG